MTALIIALSGLATEALKLVNTTKARQHVDKITDIKHEILKEESRGYHSDDAGIELLYKKLEIELNAFKDEVALYASSAAAD